MKTWHGSKDLARLRHMLAKRAPLLGGDLTSTQRGIVDCVQRFASNSADQYLIV